MKFDIITLGCKVNTYESAVIKEKLLQNNYIFSSFNPDVIIINTCSVTNMADNKSKKLIRKAKRDNPNVILIVCGCTAQNHKELLSDLDIDILIGNKDKSKIVNILEDYLKTKDNYIKFYNIKDALFEDMQISKFTTQTRAYIKIQDGCNNYCAFCIIPYLRGNIRFKDFDTAISETKELVRNEHKEIVLTGIHTGSYPRLVELIDRMSKIQNLERIRISSIEITEINEDFLNLLKNNPKVCNHLHIPLQSGSEEILKLMNRKYNKQYFSDIINKIRIIRPEISISTDVIVGFPGETEELFNESLEFCKEIGFSKIHVFPYSVRNGTKAESLPNHVDNNIKKIRSRELIGISDELENIYYEKFLNKEIEVLIEENIDNTSIGHTSNFLKIIVNEKIEQNNIVKVKIIDIKNLTAIGEIL